eukprot:3850766-Pyramimonas_sp.AAC.1
MSDDDDDSPEKHVKQYPSLLEAFVWCIMTRVDIGIYVAAVQMTRQGAKGRSHQEGKRAVEAHEGAPSGASVSQAEPAGEADHHWRRSLHKRARRRGLGAAGRCVSTCRRWRRSRRQMQRAG